MTAVPEATGPGGQAPVPDARCAGVAPGLYRHYKGGQYEVLGLVRHSETLEVHVLYRALYGARGMWVRPCAMFLEMVEVDGVPVARFARQDAADPAAMPHPRNT